MAAPEAAEDAPLAVYTPTTAAVRERYSMQEPVQGLLRAEFDRWLAAHDVQVAQQALLDAADLLRPHSTIRAFLAHQAGPSVDAAWLRALAANYTPKGT